VWGKGKRGRKKEHGEKQGEDEVKRSVVWQKTPDMKGGRKEKNSLSLHAENSNVVEKDKKA